MDPDTWLRTGLLVLGSLLGTSTEVTAVLAVVAVLILVVIAALLFLLRRARGRVGRENRRRGGVARRAELEAEALLRDEGFTVLDRQVHLEYQLRVDGRELPARLRADLLVERRGRRFVADVKTGTEATRPSGPATRRQLLEYRLAYDVEGVLLIDMDRRRICEVEFPF